MKTDFIHGNKPITRTQLSASQNINIQIMLIAYYIVRSGYTDLKLRAIVLILKIEPNMM